MPWITPEGQQVELPQEIHHCNIDEPLQPSLLMHKQALLLPFTSAAEGRPFSWCSRLRRLGYSGPIVAAGELGLDRLAYAFRCGFSLAWLSDAEVGQLGPIHLRPFSHYYQGTT